MASGTAYIQFEATDWTYDAAEIRGMMKLLMHSIRYVNKKGMCESLAALAMHVETGNGNLKIGSLDLKEMRLC
jgi:hypothetical protein